MPQAHKIDPPSTKVVRRNKSMCSYAEKSVSLQTASVFMTSAAVVFTAAAAAISITFTCYLNRPTLSVVPGVVAVMLTVGLRPREFTPPTVNV